MRLGRPEAFGQRGEDHADCACVGEGPRDSADPACPACGGTGAVLGEEPRAALERWSPVVGAFLAEYAVVRRHGLPAWMEMNGAPDPAFIEAIEVFEGEIERLVEEERRRREKK